MTLYSFLIMNINDLSYVFYVNERYKEITNFFMVGSFFQKCHFKTSPLIFRLVMWPTEPLAKWTCKKVKACVKTYREWTEKTDASGWSFHIDLRCLNAYTIIQVLSFQNQAMMPCTKCFFIMLMLQAIELFCYVKKTLLIR